MLRTSAALSSATQHAMPPEYGKWGTECLNTKFPQPILLCAGYSVKLKTKHINIYTTHYILMAELNATFCPAEQRHKNHLNIY